MPGDRDDGQEREEPHPHDELVVGRPAPQHQLGDRDQQVDEQDHRARGVQQEQEDGVRRGVRRDHAEEADHGRGQDRPHRDAAAVHADQSLRRLLALGQHEEHPRGRVEPGVEAREHGRQDDRVHDVVGVRDAHLVEGGDVRRGAELVVVPRHDADQQDHRADEERRDAEDDRLGRLRDRPLGVLGLGRGDGGDLGADHREHHDHDAREDRADAVGQEPAVAGHLADVEVLVRATARPRTGCRAPGRR